jgi:hypothetical protein
MVGFLVFLQDVDTREEYLGKPYLRIYGCWEFEEGTELREWTAAEMCDALLWADKNGRRISTMTPGSLAAWKGPQHDN